MVNIAFPNTINEYKPWGVPGDFADSNYNHMYPLTLLVKEPTESEPAVTIGKFVWDNGDDTGSAFGTGVPTGVAHRVLDIPITDIEYGATMIVPPAYKVAIADKGSLFMEISDVPVIGNKIFVNNTTGVITNGAAGATETGATETSFKIINLCDNTAAAGNIVIVTNWS